MTIDAIRARLDSLCDPVFQAFQARLLPTIPPWRVLGVRTPQLRRFAKELLRTGGNEAFLACLPHPTVEESTLHGFLIEGIGDFDACVAALDVFLPHVDNWFTCDVVSPKVFRGRLDSLLPPLRAWMRASHPYTVRYGIGMLLRYGLEDDTFIPDYLAEVAALPAKDYYVRMMVAWFFATALARQFDATLPYLLQRRLPSWIHNKTIQKACESYRISAPQKALLRSFRV